MIAFWVFVLAVSMLLYVLLDGFDLGVGILSGTISTSEKRDPIWGAISPVWDGNETWLVSSGVVLWGAFPLVYSTLMSAFYLPLLLMLAGLTLRGVAFEFRHRAGNGRWIWDVSFAVGSVVATLMQGMMVGALVEGLPMAGAQYAGGDFGWLTPFSLLCGMGLCIGYSLLGACWLVLKCEGNIREMAYRFIPYLAFGLLFYLIAVFAYALADNLPVMQRWVERPYLLVFPAAGAAAAILLALGTWRREDAVPFPMVAFIFAAAFATLAISFWPYMIPFSVTIFEAAAPASSLSFMFWGAGLFVFPLMLIYTTVNYVVFRGKVQVTGQH